MPWYVLRTKPQHEIKVAQRIAKLDLEVYCPVMKVVRQWSDRRKKIEVPLFRSYVFVHLKPSEKNLVYDVPGILGFLNWLQKPAIVQKDEIDTIKS